MKLWFWRWVRRVHDELHVLERVDFWDVPNKERETYTSPAVHYTGNTWTE